jgi:type IV pilus modification protein PilV
LSLRKIAGPNRPGLTLVEVLFAVSVLAFALLGVAGMFPSAMRSVQSGGETTKATMLAREMIDMIRADSYANVGSGGYTSFDTSTLTVTCPATQTVPPATPDPNYNKKKWTCDIAATGTRGTGQGLPGGHGTVSVTCVNFNTAIPFTETTITCPPPSALPTTTKVTVTVTWGAQGSRSVSLVTYVFWTQ